MINLAKIIAAEYSPSQKCFHVQQLSGAIEDVLMDLATQNVPDWYVIGIFEEEIEAHRFIEKVRDMILPKPIA